MRLINIQSYALEEFYGDATPPYAILSHRWEEEELTFRQMSMSKIQQTFFNRTSSNTKGYRKLKMACEKVAEFKLKYLWIDTCCIDKSSSAKLSEAINSMYRWYQKAEICLAYLSDVGRFTQRTYMDEKKGAFMTKSDSTRFQDSIWFTRAWTLQELIAPFEVHFYSSCWTHIGTKETLAPQIEAATSIPQAILLHDDDLEYCSIAERMSWASGREATRVEDVAYSLMGIFNVHMPLLYGEGEAAYIRLQEEIIKRSLDRSFLLWDRAQAEVNLLAKSPHQFLRKCEDKERSMTFYRDHLSSTPFALSNAGLEIELELFWWDMNTYAARVAQTSRITNGEYPSMYTLLKLPRTGRSLYGIGTVEHVFAKAAKSRLQRVTIKRDVLDEECTYSDFCGFNIAGDSLKVEEHVELGSSAVWGTDENTGLQRCFLDFSQPNSNAYMEIDIIPDFRVYVVVSFGFEFNPNICINRKSHGFYFVHSRENIAEADFEMTQGAKTVIRPRPGTEGERRWVCKIVDRQGAYVTLPDFLSPAGLRVGVYIDYIVGKDETDLSTGAWQIAFTKREISATKPILQTFIEDPFFTSEASLFGELPHLQKW